MALLVLALALLGLWSLYSVFAGGGGRFDQLFGPGVGVDYFGFFKILGLTLILELTLMLFYIHFLRWFSFTFCVGLHSLLALVCIYFWRWFDSSFGVRLTLVLTLILI